MIEKKPYLLSYYTGVFSKEELAKADQEIQKNVIREWFLSRFEDPAENTPYESKEGGYIYIWGGPDFASKLEAQTCYEFCFSSFGDVHYLDEDGDGRACEAFG